MLQAENIGKFAWKSKVVKGFWSNIAVEAIRHHPHDFAQSPGCRALVNFELLFRTNVLHSHWFYNIDGFGYAAWHHQLYNNRLKLQVDIRPGNPKITQNENRIHFWSHGSHWHHTVCIPSVPRDENTVEKNPRSAKVNKYRKTLEEDGKIQNLKIITSVQNFNI